jgi:hypothetical protein
MWNLLVDLLAGLEHLLDRRMRLRLANEPDRLQERPLLERIPGRQKQRAVRS